MLYDLTDGHLVSATRTNFAAENILERKHLQSALRGNIEVLGDDLLVVAEEFGDFEGSHRRIDLLCVDKAGKLVVVEIKRTEDGGHMELQALRYAAMVSAMTRDQLEETFEHYLSAQSSPETADAAEVLSQWFDDADDEPVVISREVRIILVSADFGREVTTTVLWLNDVFGTDITCVRLSPYRVNDRLLLDVQQVIPLPEAEEYTTQLRRRERAVNDATTGADWTQFVISTPSGDSEPLRKRRAVLALVSALHDAGTPIGSLRGVLKERKLLPVEGTLSGAELEDAFVRTYPVAERNMGRWFFEQPLHDQGRTWVLSKMWGLDTEATLGALIKVAGVQGFSFRKA